MMGHNAADVETLLPAIRKGEEQAWRRLVQMLGEPLVAYAGTISGNLEDARDAVQKTFIRLHQRRREIDSAKGSLRGYCYRITRNIARNAVRDANLRKQREEEATAMASGSEDADQTLAKEAWQFAHDLPTEVREPILLRFAHGLSRQEIASVLGTPEGTIATRQRNGLEELRSKLTRSLPAIGLIPLDRLERAMQTHHQFPAALLGSSVMLTTLEATVMAAIGTKANGVLIAAILCLLLLGGMGIGIVALGNGSSEHTLLHVENEENPTGKPSTPSTLTVHDDQSVEAPINLTSNEVTNPGEEEPKSVSAFRFNASLTGRVVNSSSQPVSDATIRVIGDFGVNESKVSSISLEEKTLHTSTTRKDGTFDFEFSFSTSSQVTKIHFRLETVAEGYGTNLTPTMWVPNKGLLDQISTVLYRPTSISGRVLYDDNVTLVENAALRIDATTSQYLSFVTSGYHLTVEGGYFKASDLQPGEYRLKYKDGDSSCSMAEDSKYSFSIKEGEQRSNIDLILRRSGSIIFRLDPQPEGRVSILAVGDQISPEGRDEGKTLISLIAYPDSEGVYRIDHPADGIELFTILPTGYTPLSLDVKIDRNVTNDLGTLRLSKGVLLRGQVVDAKGRGIAQQTISLNRIIDDLPVDTMHSYVVGNSVWSFAEKIALEEATTVSDDSGHFSFDSVGSGDCVVATRHSPYGRVRQEVVIPPSVSPPPITLTFENLGLSRLLGNVKGQITINGHPPTPRALGALGTGESLDIQLVGMEKNKSFRYAPTLIDSLGKFRFEDIPIGPYQINVKLGERRNDSEIFSIGENETLNIDIDFTGGSTITGTVRDASGSPMVGAKLKLTSERAESYHRVSGPETFTDTYGRFRFTGVNGGSYYIRVKEDGDMLTAAQLAKRAVTVDEEGEYERNIVVGTNTQPVVSGKVQIGGRALFNEAIVVKPDQPQSMRSFQIDSEGHFTIPELESGQYYIWFVDNKFSLGVVQREIIQITDEETLHLGHNYPTATLHASVSVGGVDSDFSYRDVTLRLTPELEDSIGADPIRSYATITTAFRSDGKLAIDDLAEGRYTAIASASGFAPCEMALDLQGEVSANFTLGESAGKLSVNIASIAGEETATKIEYSSVISKYLLVKLTNSRGEAVSLSNQDQFLMFRQYFTANFESLPADTYTLDVIGAYIEPVHQEIFVRPNDTTKVRLDIHRGATIRLKVDNVELTPEQVQKAQIKVADGQGNPVLLDKEITALAGISLEAAASKTLNITPLEAGTYTITVKLKGYKDYSTTLSVKRSSILDQEIVLEND